MFANVAYVFLLCKKKNVKLFPCLPVAIRVTYFLVPFFEFFRVRPVPVWLDGRRLWLLNGSLYVLAVNGLLQVVHSIKRKPSGVPL